MFGLFYLLANAIGITASGTKRAVDNSYFKKQGWKRHNNGKDFGIHTYYDALGRERDLSTNHIMFSYKRNGDLFLEDTKTGNIRNISDEQKKKETKLIQDLNSNIKAIFYKYWDYENSPLKDNCGVGIPGTVYIDINNHQLYFERYITWRESDFSKPGIVGDYKSAYFYLSISDGKIVSISDQQRKIDIEKDRQYDYQEFILFFNLEQERGGFVVRNRNEYAKGKDSFYLANEELYNNI